MSKRVLITGGAKRIGAAIARRLATDGWEVVVHYHAAAAEAAALAAELRAAGGACGTIGADLADRRAIAALIPDCIARFGPLDALVNNASSFRYDDLATLDPASWDFHLAPNLEAPLFLARDFARARGAEGGGAIVNMLDQKVVNPNPDFLSYSVAKMGLAGATRMLAMYFGGRIRVCGIAPGITLISGKQTEQGFARAWHAPPLGRSSTPEEIADCAALILATPLLNGQIFVLDGGESLRGRSRDIAFDTAG